MAAYVKFQPFVEHLAEGAHILGTDQLVVALTTNANIPAVSTALLASVTEIAYTNLSTRNITNGTSSQTSGTYKLLLTDHVLTASGAVATFRHVIIYNDGTTVLTNPLICMYDYGSDVTLANGETFTIDFDGSAGFITIA